MIQIDCTVLKEDIDNIATSYANDPCIVDRIMTDLMECGIIDKHWGKYIYTEKGEYFANIDTNIQNQVEQYIKQHLNLV